jgi:hypothetical protein
MKIKAFLAAVIVMFVFTTVQAQISVSSTPVTTIRSDGKVEKTGDVVLTFTANTPATGTDVITLDYGVAVDITAISTSQVTLTGTSVGTITKSGNIVSVPLTFTNAATGSLTLRGVRVNVAGSGLTSLSVSISTTTVSIVAGQNITKVVNSISAPTKAGKSTDPKAAILDDGSIVVTVGQLTVEEEFASAWTVSAQEGTTGVTNGYQLKLVLAGTLPTGVTLGLTASTASSPEISGTVTFTPSVLSSAATKSTIKFNTNTNLALAEKLIILFTTNVKTSGTGAITKPLASAVISATVTSDPDDTTTSIPRFTVNNLPSGGQTVLNIVSTVTNILYTFTTWDASLGFDTGIDVANTSSDPFAVNGATASAGAITYNFFPRGGGASFSYTTTAGSPGVGLEADGSLASGGSHTVLVSELVTVAGQTGPFTGYIVAVCGFTHGHGEGFVLDGPVIAQTLNGLIIPSPGQNSRKTGGTGESLGR